MTKPKNPTVTEATEPLPLPGLGAFAAGATPLEIAARRSLTALAAAGLISEEHSIINEGILSLSRVMASAERKGQAAASAMAFAQILAAFAVLMPEVEGGENDAFDELASELRASALDAARSAAEVRDA